MKHTILTLVLALSSRCTAMPHTSTAKARLIVLCAASTSLALRSGPCSQAASVRRVTVCTTAPGGMIGPAQSRRALRLLGHQAQCSRSHAHWPIGLSCGIMMIVSMPVAGRGFTGNLKRQNCGTRSSLWGTPPRFPLACQSEARRCQCKLLWSSARPTLQTRLWTA
jgi:hypothetical protein